MTPEKIFRSLYLIRRVEEKIAEVYPTDLIQSPVHLSIGMELASVAVCAALKPEDKVFGSYRSHALYLAKGGDLKAFVAEIYGKRTGCAKGKGGSMHMVEPRAGLLGTSAIVGSLIPVAVGYAWAQKLRKTGVVTAVFFGDGATEEGAFYESLNLAALHSLPILFVCENNGYAIHTPQEERQERSIFERADSIGIASKVVRGHDETISAAADLVKYARSFCPALLEIQSTRMKEHVGPNEDWAPGYREPDPTRQDPLVDAGLKLSTVAMMNVQSAVDAEIAEAFAFAASSPVPGPEDLMADLYG